MKNEIASSWNKNAKEWINVITEGQIASRKFTNPAILEALIKHRGKKILDLGCGEGWLTRELSKNGKLAVGIDGTEALIKKARQLGNENFYHLSYEDIIAKKSIPEAPYDLAAFNFCLYQKEETPVLLKEVKKALTPKGQIVIQTLHPFFLKASELPYKNQWINDAWKGLPGNFTDGHPWYAQTFEGWSDTFRASGLQVAEIKEVSNDKGDLLSVIFSVN
ncbi:class I SAM-dependent methyltransferase [Flavobacteriaceae bacterium M23B6Z8]